MLVFRKVKMETNEDITKQMGSECDPELIVEMTREVVQSFVDDLPDTSKEKLSDGYHTFKELYDHRIVLWIALCKSLKALHRVWKSKLHFDGTSYEGYFILGMLGKDGKQMTYHVPNKWWDACEFADTYANAPEFDGHTSEDVLKRVLKVVGITDKDTGGNGDE